MSDERPMPKLEDLLREAGLFQQPTKASWQKELATARAAIKTNLEKAAKDNGITPQELWSEFFVSLVIAIQLNRASRRGDVAKTVRWGVASLGVSLKWYARRQEQRLDKIAKLVDIREI